MNIDKIHNLIPFIAFIILIAVMFRNRVKKVAVNPDQCARAWERLIGFIIDIVICYILLFILTIGLRKCGVDVTEVVLDFLFLPLMWLYFSLLESSRYQATLGKIAEGIIVTDLNGKRIGFLRASARFFASIISYMPLCLGHIIIAFTKYKQGLHDMLTNTLVVKKGKNRKGKQAGT